MKFLSLQYERMEAKPHEQTADCMVTRMIV